MLQFETFAPAGLRPRGSLSEDVVVGSLRALDGFLVLAAGLLAYLTRVPSFAGWGALEVYALCIAVLLVAHAFQIADLYRLACLSRPWAWVHRLALAWTFVILALVALAFITKTAEEASRAWVVLWFVYGAIGLVGVRLLLGRQIRRWQRAGHLVRNVAVVGAGEHGRRFVERMRRSADPAIRLVGLFDDRRSRVPDRVADCPVLGTTDDLIRLARGSRIDQVVIALPGDADDRLRSWLTKFRNLPVDVSVCPGVVAVPSAGHQVTHLGGVPMLTVFERPLSGWSYVIKALEDRLLAILILALAGPLMLLIALAVRLDSPGPALFRQRRYGFNNEAIEVFKFRTMRADAAQNGEGTVVQAGRDDPRVTRIGRWLRRTSLDELPQLLNVLRGEMSIVGPRPLAVAHNEQYAPLIEAYLARHRVKPGITGWAQVNGLRGETATLDTMERRVQYDLYYIENWSLGFDLRILARTLLVGFVHPNAY